LFLAYKVLENEVISYPITRANVKGESKEPQQFISYVDAEMGRLGNIAIGFDYTKISYTDSFSITGKTGASGNVNGNANTTRTGNRNQ
jgi:hypothetical protein